MRWFLVGLVFLMACSAPMRGSKPDFSRLSFPLYMQSSPDEKYLYIVNTNFDLDYNSGWISVYNVESKKLLLEQGVIVPSYGGKLIFGPKNKRLFLPIRADSSIVVIDVEGKKLICNKDSSNRECSGEFIVPNKNVKDPKTGEEVPQAGTDAYSACVMNSTEYGPLLFVASVSDSFVAAYSLKGDMPKYITHLKVDPGVVDLACDEMNNRVFAAHRSSNQINEIVIEKTDLSDESDNSEVFTLKQRRAFGAPMEGNVADYFRSIKLAENNNILYATYRSSDSILKFDISKEDPVCVSTTPVPAGPAQLSILNVPVYGTFLFVVCTDDSSVVVLDESTMQLQRRVVLDRDPYTITLLPQHSMAAVSCFRDNSVALLKWEQNPGFTLKLGGWIK